MSPDPSSGSYDPGNPQSFNRYSYALNNPLVFTDPSGQEACLAAIGAGAEAGPIGAGVGIGACIAELFDAGSLLDDLAGLFSGPSFHGSLTPRPESTGDPSWDGNFGEGLGIPTSIPQTSVGLALGLPSQGCDFGACGGGLDFGPGSGASVAGRAISTIPLPIFNLLSLLHGPYSDVTDPNHRFFGTHYCGPGGGGSVGPGVDQLCAAHDACYNRENVGWLSNLNPFTSGAAMGGCDRLLCAALEGYQPTSSQERSGKDHIQQLFGCSYILKP